MVPVLAPHRGGTADRYPWRAVLLVVVALLAVPAGAQEERAAAGVVEDLHGALLEVMREAEALGFAGRRERLAPVVERSFDLPFVSRIVTGRHWESFSEAQREEMIRTFGRLTVATYAARFDGYSGEVFKLDQARPLRSERVLVRTELHGSDGDVVQLDYVLHRSDGQWRIINVIANGVSDLSIKRAEYSKVLAESGFEALIARLNEQIDGFAENGSG